jgi:hypothetical protein
MRTMSGPHSGRLIPGRRTSGARDPWSPIGDNDPEEATSV